MSGQQRLTIAIVATVILLLVGGGVGAGLTLAQQQLAATGQTEATPVAQPAQAQQTAQPLQAATRPSQPAPTEQPPAPPKRTIVGSVVSLDGDRLTIRDQKRQLRVVRVAEKTQVRRKGSQVDRSALAPGTAVTVIAAPGPDRTVDARLISVMPTPTPGPRGPGRGRP